MIGALLGVYPHQLAIIGILQPVEKEVIEHFLVPHSKAAAGILQQIGGSTHTLHTTSQHHPVVAKANGIGGQHHRLHAGATYFVDRGGRHTLGQPRLQHRLSGRGLPHTGSQHIAHEHLIYLFRTQTTLHHCRRHGTGPQLGSTHLGQCPQKGPHRGPFRRHNRNIHLLISPCYMAIT